MYIIYCIEYCFDLKDSTIRSNISWIIEYIFKYLNTSSNYLSNDVIQLGISGGGLV